jgi:hypothetical protein
MNLVIMLMPLLHHKIMLIFTAIQKLKMNSNQCLVWIVHCKLFSDGKFTETSIDGGRYYTQTSQLWMRFLVGTMIVWVKYNIYIMMSLKNSLHISKCVPEVTEYAFFLHHISLHWVACVSHWSLIISFGINVTLMFTN